MNKEGYTRTEPTIAPNTDTAIVMKKLMPSGWKVAPAADDAVVLAALPAALLLVGVEVAVVAVFVRVAGLAV